MRPPCNYGRQPHAGQAAAWVITPTPNHPPTHLSSLMTGPISSSFLAGSVPFLNTSRRPSSSSGPSPVRAEIPSQSSSPGAGPAGAAGAAAGAGAAAAARLASGTASSAGPRRLALFCACRGGCGVFAGESEGRGREGGDGLQMAGRDVCCRRADVPAYVLAQRQRRSRGRQPGDAALPPRVAVHLRGWL